MRIRMHLRDLLGHRPRNGAARIFPEPLKLGDYGCAGGADLHARGWRGVVDHRRPSVAICPCHHGVGMKRLCRSVVTSVVSGTGDPSSSGLGSCALLRETHRRGFESRRCHRSKAAVPPPAASHIVCVQVRCDINRRGTYQSSYSRRGRVCQLPVACSRGPRLWISHPGKTLDVRVRE